MDFVNEKENIKTFQRFENGVNGKVKDTKKIIVPKVYEDYSTENVIVMEQTVNKMDLTDENKIKIREALNSYIKLTFWAMFNDRKIVFHGDPHSGNICIDDDGNICFLDMGLLCALSDNDAKLSRKFFLAGYSGNYEKLYDMLVAYGNMGEEVKESFKEACRKYCDEVKTKEITYYFIDMINVCLSYEFVPPDFLFNVAKAFVCLNGIGNFSDNKCTARELLQEQAMEFLVRRSLKDCKGIVINSLHYVPEVIENVMQYGLVSTITKVAVNSEMKENLSQSLDNFKEMFDLIKLFTFDETSETLNQPFQKTKNL